MAPSKPKKATAASKNNGRRSSRKKNNGIEVSQGRGGRRDKHKQVVQPEEMWSTASLAEDLNAHDDRAGDTNQETSELEDELAAIKVALEKERMQNAELQKQIDAMVNNPNRDRQNSNSDVGPIPRPNGTAGTDFSIQEGMGLVGSAKKYETYKAIQRNLRDLAMNARINWEVPWAQVPARDKARLFEVARDQHPFLARFERDWATEELVKQFLKNKRKNHYANGWLEVPEKYAYLKENSRKRNPMAPRTKRARIGSVTGDAAS